MLYALNDFVFCPTTRNRIASSRLHYLFYRSFKFRHEFTQCFVGLLVNGNFGLRAERKALMR